MFVPEQNEQKVCASPYSNGQKLTGVAPRPSVKVGVARAPLFRSRRL